MRSVVRRRLAATSVLALAIAVVLAFASLASGSLQGVRGTAVAPTPITYVCAQKQTGQLSYLTNCTNSQIVVPVDAGSTQFKACYLVSNGITRKVSASTTCSNAPRTKEGAIAKVPADSNSLYFCVETNGLMHFKGTAAPTCPLGQYPVVIGPHDLAPSVTSTSPADGATDVATDTNVTVNFSESVTASTSSFSLECPNGTPKTFTVSGSPGSSITLDPTAALPEGTTCAVKVIASNVSDTDSADPPDHPAGDYNFSFTTDSAPSVSSTTPSNSATDVNASNNITVTFSEPVNASGSSFTVECPSGSAQSFSVSGSGTSTITLDPDSDLPSSTTCTVTVLASGITDVDSGDPPDNMAANYVFSFTTADAAPSVTTTSPADAADHVAVNTNIVVNFSEPVTVSTSSFTLECPSGTAKSFSVSGSPGSSITLDPTSDLPEGTTCTVTAIAANISDVDAVDPPDHPAANYSFSFTTDSAPAVTGSSPIDNATDVNASANIQVFFNEPVTADSSSFTISCDASPQTFQVSGSGTDTITLDPDSDLPSTATCTVTAVAANISDSDSGDPPDHPAANHSFSFTTQDAAPSVTSTSPGDGAVDVAKNTNIDVTFSEPVTATGSSFTLECPTGSAQAFSVSGSPGSTITLNPDSNLPNAEVCTVTVIANQISDVDAVDPPDNMAANYQFTFTIVANQAPTDIQLSNSSIAENQASGTDVGTLTTTDPDSGDTHTYSLENTGCGGGPFPDNSSFQIGGAGNDKLQSSASFNFEVKSSYTVCVRSTDSGSLSFDKQFTVSVTNVNEPPTDISLDNNSIDENKASGSLVGNLSQVGDPDSGETYTFTLLTSGCSASFPDSSSFQISGSALQSAVSFNFEVKNSYAICVRVNDPGSPNLSFEKSFTITINDVNDAPVDGNESVSAVGNTLLEYGSVPSPSSAAKKVLAGNLLANATDEDQPPQTLTISASDSTSANGGTVSVSSSGAFSYVPAAGFTGTDTFNYTVSDGNGGTDTSTVTITVASRVWYVKNDATAGGTGRSTDPFDTLGEADTSANQTGDITYVYKGDGTTTGLAGGFSLLANQKLLGEPVNLVVGADTLATGTPANRPSLSGTVALASGSRVEAVDIAGSGGAAIAGTNTGGSDVTNVNLSGGAGGVALTGAAAGTFNFTNFTINTTGGTGFLVNTTGTPTINVGSGSTENVSATGGAAVDVRNANGASSLAFDAVSSTNSSGAGINLDSIGAAPFNASSGSISGAAGNAIDINGGSGDVTYPGTLGDGAGNTADITGRTGGAISLSGNINDTNDAGGGITMSGNTGGSTTFSGTTKTLNTGASAAFSSTGSAHTIVFSGGGLNIDTTSGAGFSATGGGTIHASGSNNTIDTTTGTALTIQNTTIGAAGLNFRSISSNGAATGISLSGNLGGALTVTGDGTGFANGSGGSILDATTRAAYLLTVSGTISLNSMDFKLNTSAVGGILFDNNAGGTVTGNFIGCTFSGVTSSVSQEKSLLQFEAGNTGANKATVVANVQHSFFNSSRTYGFYATGAGDSVVNATVNQSGFGTDVNTGAPVNNPGSTITNPPPFSIGVTNGSNAQVDYTISNNTFWGADGLLGGIYAVTISGAGTTAGSHLNGSFSNNKIGKAGVTGSGCANHCGALGLLPGTSGTFRATVTNNDIRQVNAVGIDFFNSASPNTSSASLKVKGNVLAEPDTTGSPLFQRAITISPGNSAGANAPWCAEIGNNTGAVPADKNTISGSWQAGAFIRVNNLNNTAALTLPGLSPVTGATAAQVNAFVENANTMPAASVNSSVGTAGINGSATSCF